MSTTSKIRLGIIGIGNMGSGHAGSIVAGKCPDFELTAVADINPARLEWAKTALPGAKTFSTAEEMLDSGLIEACMICVPHYDHPEICHRVHEARASTLCARSRRAFTPSRSAR